MLASRITKQVGLKMFSPSLSQVSRYTSNSSNSYDKKKTKVYIVVDSIGLSGCGLATGIFLYGYPAIVPTIYGTATLVWAYRLIQDLKLLNNKKNDI